MCSFRRSLRLVVACYGLFVCSTSAPLCPCPDVLFEMWYVALVVGCYLCGTGAEETAVTCGSAVKLLNDKYSIRLNSIEAHYSGGSGQQIVTGIKSQTDIGSNWQVKGNATRPCRRGAPILCGTVVRLENVESKKNLHSHHYMSPITGGLEVSVFGNKGVGDSGDHWEVICSTQFWIREKEVEFRHSDTQTFLEATGYEYSDPIRGHVEVAGTINSGVKTQWRTAEGVFIQPSKPFVLPHAHKEHSEL